MQEGFVPFKVEGIISGDGENAAEDPGGEFELLPLLRECVAEAENMAIGRHLEIEKVLLTEAGAEVTEAINGKEAVDKFLSSKVGYFDGILMDILMPGLSGLEAAKLIRSSEREDGERIPIIAMSANSLKEDKNASISAGINEHLNKPLDMDKVIEILYKYCKQDDYSKSAQKS